MNRGCYTCRRRRIVCDLGQPVCRKCRKAGKECSYTKPLTWVKGGLASRGKLMGRSFDEVWPDRNAPAEGEEGPAGHQYLSSVWDSGDKNAATSLVMQSTQSISPVFSLVDPIFQDVPRLSRFYIHHYNEKCTPDLALYDAVKNPYRDLIPYTSESSLLTDALAAVGAIHYAYLSSCNDQRWLVSPSTPPDNSLPCRDEELDVSVLEPSQSANPEAYRHYLCLKQRALRQLSHDLSDPIGRNDDRTVAAIFVLVLLDAIESGSGEWRLHLEGAKNLLKSREATPAVPSMQRMIDGLHTFVIDACLITEIMGSTLARPGALSKPFYNKSIGPIVLKRLERTSWVGCPAHLLEVIFFVHAQRYSDSDLTTDYPWSFISPTTPSQAGLGSPADVLKHIEAFDPARWAEEMQSFLYLPDLRCRIALAAAYKAAVYLYAKRVLLSRMFHGYSPTDDIHDHVRDSAAVENDLISNLAQIPPCDVHFKCTIWPTFIAGAESTTREQRRFTLQRLGELWSAMFSVNLRNAAWVLRAMWQRQDERAATSNDHDYNNGFDWIRELDRSRADWLFI